MSSTTPTISKSAVSSFSEVNLDMSGSASIKIEGGRLYRCDCMVSLITTRTGSNRERINGVFVYKSDISVPNIYQNVKNLNIHKTQLSIPLSC